MDSSAQIGRAGFVGDIHHLFYVLVMALVLLHVGAALYHQFILKDNILSRMWYGK
jgi:cytochrome b561